MGAKRRALREHLAALAILGDDGIGLAATALVVAGLDRPATDPQPYLGHFDELAGELTAAAGKAPSRAAALAAVLGGRHRYRDDDRDDDEIGNTSLMWVVDNRRGVAAALGIVGLEATRRAGWRAEALAFPHRFLLRLAEAEGGRTIIDPAAGWRPVEAPELRAILKASAGLDAELAPSHYQASGNRDILVRLQNEAKTRLLRCGALARAVTVVEATLLFAPDRAALWREAGLMHLRLDNLAQAVAALEQFVSRTANPQARHRILRLLQELRGRMN